MISLLENLVKKDMNSKEFESQPPNITKGSQLETDNFTKRTNLLS